MTSGLPEADTITAGRHVSKVPITEVGPTDHLVSWREAQAAFAINYDGNPGQDDRPAGPALQV